MNDIDSPLFLYCAFIVLPGCDVSPLLAAHAHPALAVLLFARTSSDLDLAYKSSDLAQGLRHKAAITAY